MNHTPLLTIEYRDPESGVRGYTVIDQLKGGVAAGGMRIAPGTTPAVLVELARNMTLKQAVAGIDKGGAKAGLDMDPSHPDRDAILRRFLATMSPLIQSCWSVGPDVNTTMEELEAAARSVGIPSLKICVGRAHHIPDDVFLKRYALFDAPVGEWTVSRLRAAAAVRSAIRVVVDALGVSGRPPRVAIQGAGNMGGATAHLIAQEGALVTAWADDEKCLIAPGGLDVPALLAGRVGGRLPPHAAGAQTAPSSAIIDVACDVLVLAAVSRAFGLDAVSRLRCRGIVEAANLALDHDVERAVHDRRVLVVPDVIASVGGSVAVQALYESEPVVGQDILDFVDRRITDLARRVIADAQATGRLPRDVAVQPPR